MTDKSELERQIDASRAADYEKLEKQSVRCLCVHGSGCNVGEHECAGSCESGWTGPYCDTPKDEALYSNVQVGANRNKKDYTGDGLYRPLSIQE